MGDFAEIVASRTMQSLYIWLDLAFLLAFVVVLIHFRRYQALVVGLCGGILYFLVDYGIFYRLLGTRVVVGADTFWFLAWLSLSYGLTNFAWIWLWLDRDGHAVEWSVLVVTGWLFVAFLSQSLGYDETPIAIERGTTAYHGVMALLTFVGYGLLCVYNLRQPDKRKRAPILWILSIGVLVQFSWEAVLALSGIRDFSWSTLLVNSLLETNMGLPYLYLIHRVVTRRWNEDLQPVAGRQAVPAGVGVGGDGGVGVVVDINGEDAPGDRVPPS